MGNNKIPRRMFCYQFVYWTYTKLYGNVVVQGGKSYEQYDSGTLAGEYLPPNRQQKQFTGDERTDGVHGSTSR